MPMRIVLLMLWTIPLSSVRAFRLEQRYPTLLSRLQAIASTDIDRTAEEV
jgi:hypothetical protein